MMDRYGGTTRKPKNGRRGHESQMIRVVPIMGKGRGVIAQCPIQAGTVIEVAHVAPFDNTNDLPPGLSDFPLRWTDREDAIAFGIVSLVNHDARNPNCDLEWNIPERTVSLIAWRDIGAGEELTFDYDCPLWFEPLGKP